MLIVLIDTFDRRVNVYQGMKVVYKRVVLMYYSSELKLFVNNGINGVVVRVIPIEILVISTLQSSIIDYELEQWIE